MHVQAVRAGWSGSVNGTGYGWTYVNVTSAVGGLFNSKSSGTVTYPNVAIPSGLPMYASSGTSAYASGYAGGILSGSAYGYYGDGADNPELERRITIRPADCAELTMDAHFSHGTGLPVQYPPGVENGQPVTVNTDFDSESKSGTITVDTKGTGGTALWLRGFEFTGDPALVPIDNPATDVNETIQWILDHGGLQRFETLVVGPFEYGTCPLIIPYNLDSGDPKNLYVVSNGVAKSTPLVVNCPQDMTVECGQSLRYPDITYTGGCGTRVSTLIATYSPAPSSLHLGDNVVTVTITDDPQKLNVVRTCDFKVTVVDTTAPTIKCPAPITVPCSGGNGTAVVKFTVTASDSCAGSLVPVCVPPSGSGFPIGTTTVNCTARDSSGKTASCSFTVTVNGPTFSVFYAPISGTGGGCGGPQQPAPLRTINQGSVIPVKFDLFCGTTAITTGTQPRVKIQQWSTGPGCGEISELVDVNAVYQNDWHYNWDTTGWAKGIYKVIAISADGSTSIYAFVKLK